MPVILLKSVVVYSLELTALQWRVIGLKQTVLIHLLIDRGTIKNFINQSRTFVEKVGG